MIEVVRERSMCIGCGFCALVCHTDAISMVWDLTRTWLPEVDASACTECGLCLKVCPNSEVVLTSTAEQMGSLGIRFGLDDNKTNVSCITYERCADDRIRSASGGTTTVLLKELVSSGEVDCVVCAAPRMAPAGEHHFEMRICARPEELDACRSSAYGPLRYDQLLRRISEQGKTCALVGLPCTMRAVKRLPPKFRKLIKYTVSLMCSHNVTDRFSDFMAHGHGIRNEPFQINLRDNQSIPNANEFNTCLRTSTGRIFRSPRFRNGFTPAWRGHWFAQKGCLYCPDFYGADADISVKDAWGRLSGDPLGITLCIVRNSRILEILKKLSDQEELHFELCDAEEIAASQPGTVRYKQGQFRSRWNRLGFPAGQGKANPAASLDCVMKSCTISVTQRMGQTETGLRVLHAYCRLKTFGSRCSNGMQKALKKRVDVPFWRKAVREMIGILRDDLEKLARPLRLLPFAPPAKLKNCEGHRVLLTGGYGYGNVGDEAQLNANILRWRKAMPNARLTALSPHPDYTESEHDVHSENAPRVVWFNSNLRAYYWAANVIFVVKFGLLSIRQLVAARLMKAGLPPLLVSAEEAHLLHLVQRANILHVSGGGFLTGMTRSRLWENALLLKLSDVLGTPSVLTGQTVGIFKSSADRRLARWGLSRAKAIYLRDSGGSERDLESIGIKGEHVRSLYDDALFCDLCPEGDAISSLEKAGLDSAKPYVAVNFHYWGMSPEMRDRATRRFAELCNYAQQSLELQILLLPMAPSDEIPLKALQGQLGGPSGLLAYGYDFRVARGVIARAEWVFTMKHHPIIFAQGEGVPVMAVCLDDYYYRKNKGAMAHFGHERFCLDESAFFSPDAKAMVLEFGEHGAAIRASMVLQLNRFRGLEDRVLPGLLEDS